MPTTAEFLAEEVAKEFAKLKRSGVQSVDFSALMTQVINKHGIPDAAEVSHLRSEISRIFAARRAAVRPVTLGNLKISRKRKASDERSLVSQLRLERALQEAEEMARAANENICPVD